MKTMTCLWVVVDGGRASVGQVVSGHHSEASARLEADRIGGCYESADIMAMVQSGVSYTEAVQAHAHRDRLPARVTIGQAVVAPDPGDVWVYEVKAAQTDDVAHYAYRDEAACRRDAADRIAQGEAVTVRRYERISGGFVTLFVAHMGPRDHCKVGHASLREAHAAGETNVHGYAPVPEAQTGREQHAERVRMGWA